MVRLRIAFTFVFGLIILCMAGCGPTHFTPSGVVTKGGQPLKVSDKGVTQIALYPESDKAFGDAHAVNWDKDTGTFKVVGKTGTGVPAGKYKLSISIVDPYTGKPSDKDILDGKFARENAPVIEINSNSEIKIDVDKK